MPKPYYGYFILASLFLYSVACFTPIFIGAEHLGWVGLWLGWAALETELGIGLPWLANVFFFANLILWRLNRSIKISLSVLTILLALIATGINEDPDGSGEPVFVGFGFVFWLLSFVSLLLGQLYTKKS